MQHTTNHARPPLLRRRLSRPLARGLNWIHEQAEANFQAVEHEHNTGAFTGTRRGEVEDALIWLGRLLRESAEPKGDRLHGRKDNG